jgi:hypothetical protein
VSESAPDDPTRTPSDPPGAPEPEPIRFFGTTWVRHDGGYALRRVGVAVGALVTAVLGALVLVFGFQGLTDADVGLFVNALAIAGFAVCSVLMFGRTWRGYVRRRALPGQGADPDAGSSMQGLYVIGFVGALLAYFVRSLYEAPGERLNRAEYDQAREQYERRRARSAGNPAMRAAGKRRRR